MIIVLVGMQSCLRATSSGIFSIEIVPGISLRLVQDQKISIPGTCEICLCALLANTSLFFSFNCFDDNGTCEMHFKSDQGKAFTLMKSNSTDFYFLTLPTYQESTGSTPKLKTTSMSE